MSYIIAIDGPAGSGKSTVSKIVANDLNFLFISSGQLYRICAYYYNDKKYNLVDTKFIDFMRSLKIDYQKGNFIVNGKDIVNQLITSEIAMIASKLATDSLIRDFVNDTIRTVFKDKNIIMDGRDIGTVVFPNANLKIFLFASIGSRVNRRRKELKEKGLENESFIKMFFSIWKRDHQDRHRKIAPLKKAKDAIKLNTSSMDIQTVVDKIKDLYKQNGGIHE